MSGVGGAAAETRLVYILLALVLNCGHNRTSTLSLTPLALIGYAGPGRGGGLVTRSAVASPGNSRLHQDDDATISPHSFPTTLLCETLVHSDSYTTYSRAWPPTSLQPEPPQKSKVLHGTNKGTCDTYAYGTSQRCPPAHSTAPSSGSFRHASPPGPRARLYTTDFATPSRRENRTLR